MIHNTPNLTDLKIGGVKINYYFICKKKLWLFSHGINMEQNSERVETGKILHEDSFSREKRDEVLIDNTISVDFISKDNAIHEVKLSNKMKDADKWQILYYLYFLKQKGLNNLIGIIHYPKLKKKEEYKLTESDEKEITGILDGIRKIQTSKTCPEVPLKPICKKCAYYEFCWG